MKRQRKAPVAKVEIIDVPRRWWQSKQVRLRCSCGWESWQTWPARPVLELDFIDRFARRACAELHWSSGECGIQGRGHE